MPEIQAVDYLSTKAFKHFYYETYFLTTFYITDPLTCLEIGKNRLNYFKNLFVIASKRKEISRKNMLNFKLIKFPLSLYYEKSPENICGLINNFTATSVLLAVCLVFRYIDRSIFVFHPLNSR